MHGFLSREVNEYNSNYESNRFTDPAVYQGEKEQGYAIFIFGLLMTTLFFPAGAYEQGDCVVFTQVEKGCAWPGFQETVCTATCDPNVGYCEPSNFWVHGPDWNVTWPGTEYATSEGGGYEADGGAMEYQCTVAGNCDCTQGVLPEYGWAYVVMPQSYPNVSLVWYISVEREISVRYHLPGTGPWGASHKWYRTLISRSLLTKQTRGQFAKIFYALRIFGTKTASVLKSLFGVIQNAQQEKPNSPTQGICDGNHRSPSRTTNA